MPKEIYTRAEVIRLLEAVNQNEKSPEWHRQEWIKTIKMARKHLDDGSGIFYWVKRFWKFIKSESRNLIIGFKLWPDGFVGISLLDLPPLIQIMLGSLWILFRIYWTIVTK